ncbi:MAG: heavy metal translocating P-type ATPase [Aeriscardovia aeriphila]|nr:heavy metal translocating P-type ATPase [Aeriscardovia aeriphila]
MPTRPHRSFGELVRRFVANAPMLFVTVIVGIVSTILWFSGNSYPHQLDLFSAACWTQAPAQTAAAALFTVLTIFTALDELFGFTLDGIITGLIHGEVGADFLAVIALISTLCVREFWAAWIVDVMVYSGEAIETYAQLRAKRNLTALIDAAPQIAHIVTSTQALAEQAEKLDQKAGKAAPETTAASNSQAGATVGQTIAASDASESIDPNHPFFSTGENAPAEEMASEWETVPVEQVKVGDLLMVRPGETIPVNGTLVSRTATVDLSMINGEPVPADVFRGDQLSSGAVNGASALLMRATAAAGDSQYQRILDLVRSAQESRASVVKTADLLAMPFTVVSLVIAIAAWIFTAMNAGFSAGALRFTQVLVLATPCPLLIAAPVAFMGGTGRLAHAGIIIKSQDVLENLGRVSHIFFDKTGTLTHKRPAVSRVDIAPAAQSRFTADHVLAIAGPLEAYSVHILAKGIRSAGDKVLAEHNIDRPRVTNPQEIAGQGEMGMVNGHEVKIGRFSFVTGNLTQESSEAQAREVEQKEAELISQYFSEPLAANEMATYVSIDGEVTARIILKDFARENARQSLDNLKKLGIDRLSMVTGDKPGSAQVIAQEVGISDVKASLLPEEKVAAVAAAHNEPGIPESWPVRMLRRINREPAVQPVTMMVGDGVNDAPTLASADIGVAMTDGSSTAASESAQVVIMNDNIAMVPRAITISRQTKRTMLQASSGGILIAIVTMLLAAFNFIPVVIGAVLQEVIDVSSIFWALTALIDKK